MKLESLVDIQDNKRKPVTKSDRELGEYPYYGGGGIQDYVDSYIFDGDYILLGEDGAPFFDKSRPVAFSLHDSKFWANNHIHVLKAKNSVNQDYLAYYLNTVNYEQYVSQGVIPKLNQASMRSIEIYLPKDINEQKRIASILRDYDKMLDSQNGLSEIIRRERVYSQDCSSNTPKCDWKTVKLSDIVKITSGEFVKKDLQSDDAEYPVYNGGMANTGFYSQFNSEGPKVILSSRGASAGFVNKVQGRFWAGNSCYILNIIDSNKVDFDYLYYIMKCNEKKLQNQQVSGAIPAVNMGQVYDLDIDIPVDIQKQKRIASILSNYDNMIDSQEKLTDIIQRERESLQQKLFN